MDPATIATDPMAAAAVLPAIPAVPIAPAIIAPQSYETTLAMANETIGTLPLLHPCPIYSSIQALERDLFNKLQAIQSLQSE